MVQFVEVLQKYWPYLSIPVVFLAIVAWTYRAGAKKGYKADGNIPLGQERDDDKKRPSAAH